MSQSHVCQESQLKHLFIPSALDLYVMVSAAGRCWPLIAVDGHEDCDNDDEGNSSHAAALETLYQHLVLYWSLPVAVSL